MKRVQAELKPYTFSEKGKTRHARAFALVSEDGSPLFVGLFVTEAKAEEYCKARGWRLIKEAA